MDKTARFILNLSAPSIPLEFDDVVFETLICCITILGWSGRIVLSADETPSDIIHPLHPEAPWIEHLVILAGPSGAGKTTMARAMLERASNESESTSGHAGLRTDSKTLLTRLYSGGVLIVEYSTTALMPEEQAIAVHHQIQNLIDRSKTATINTLRIDKNTLVSRYIGRMSEEKLRRTPEFMRYLRFRKWRQVAKFKFGP